MMGRQSAALSDRFGDGAALERNMARGTAGSGRIDRAGRSPGERTAARRGIRVTRARTTPASSALHATVPSVTTTLIRRVAAATPVTGVGVCRGSSVVDAGVPLRAALSPRRDRRPRPTVAAAQVSAIANVRTIEPDRVPRNAAASNQPDTQSPMNRAEDTAGDVVLRSDVNAPGSAAVTAWPASPNLPRR